MKLVQERAGNTLERIDIGNDLLNRTQVAQKVRERFNKWDYIELKNFCKTKEIVSKLKKPCTEREKVFAAIHMTG
jgi:hypothetical protein